MRRSSIWYGVGFMGFALSVALLPGCGSTSAVVTIGQLGALSAAVGEVQKALSSVVAQADDATKNRINQANTAATTTLKNLKGVIDDAANSTAEQREEAARQAFNVLAESQKLVSDSGRDIFTNLNQTLASASATIDAIPFVNVPDTVLAVSPYKLRRDSRDREVSIYGYFPSIASDPSAVKVTVDGSPVGVKRSVGRIFFDLPEDAMKHPKPVVDVAIQLPKKGLLHRVQTPIDTGVRLLSDKPYKFTVEAAKENPAAQVTIDGAAHMERADSSNPSRNVHLDAESLFNTTVNDPKYDAKTAQIVNIRPLPAGHAKACEDCPDPSGGVTGWTGAAVEIAIGAPNCGAHFVRHDSDGPFGIKIFGGYQCGGGGSFYEVNFVPTFTVRVKGVPETEPIERKVILAGWKSVVKTDLPEQWTSAVVTLDYDDSFDKASSVLVVKKGVPTASLPPFDVKVENAAMLISTR